MIRYSHELQRGQTPAAVAFQVTAWEGAGHTPEGTPESRGDHGRDSMQMRTGVVLPHAAVVAVDDGGVAERRVK